MNTKTILSFFTSLLMSLLKGGMVVVALMGQCASFASEVEKTKKDIPIIEVGGVLNGSAFWTADNIYWVANNITVPVGSSLQVQAGTTIVFSQGRGINVEGGNLSMVGNETDSIRLLPNHGEGETWNWNGITLSAIDNPDDVVFDYVVIKNAVKGITGQNAHYVSLTNSLISDVFFIGVSLTNSSNWNVSANLFTDNFIGVEIYATGNGNQASFNTIAGNTFSNFITNISIQSNNHGYCYHNVVEENLIKNSQQGVWLFSSNLGTSAHTHISRNIIINNGNDNDGFGIYNSMDSTFISHNIFWRNTTAAAFVSTGDSYFHNNSIYENKMGIMFRNNSSDIAIGENTFTGNDEDVITFLAGQNVLFSGNNIFRNRKDTAIVKNLTPFDINISHSYWEATQDSIIEKLLYDFSNDPALGVLDYKPILEQANTQAPVSAPSGFVKQIVEGSVRLSWRANPESDLLGYRVFYGEFSHYSFSDSTELLTDTVFFLPEDTTGTIGIAAYDQDYNKNKDQSDGNKSPYALASAIPYAGTDTTLCVDVEVFNIEHGHVPASWDEFSWTTSGDGSFSNPEHVSPAYFPGEEDRASGSVVLRLSAQKGEQVVYDEFLLSFAPLPLAYAGKNSFIAPEDTFNTSEAYALHEDSIQWESSGDGVFSHPDSILTDYTPGPEDINRQQINLVLTIFSRYCETVRDTVTIFIRPAYSIEGSLWYDHNPVSGNPVVAFLMEDDPTELPTRFLTWTDDKGVFRFDRLFRGEYILYVPSDTLPENNQLPSYYVEQSRWEKAYIHDLTGNTYGIDIRIPALNTSFPSGNGTIRGHFALPKLHPDDKDVYCQPWFSDSQDEFCNGGLSNISILLYSLSGKKIYGHTLTDVHGNFSFTHLPYGTYILEVEMAGFESLPSLPLHITPQQEVIESVSLSIKEALKINIVIPEDNPAPGEMILYPNPARDKLTVFGPSFSDGEVMEAQIHNMAGQPVLKQKVALTGLQKTFHVGHLLPGNYVLTLISGDSREVFLFSIAP